MLDRAEAEKYFVSQPPGDYKLIKLAGMKTSATSTRSNLLSEALRETNANFLIMDSEEIPTGHRERPRLSRKEFMALCLFNCIFKACTTRNLCFSLRADL